MKLNIETKNPEATLKALREVYSNAVLVKTYDTTADFNVSDNPQDIGRVWPLEGLLNLKFYGIPFEAIRIW